ncbi:MAG: hypothetical protein JO227_18750 [Acetobacteraceae bacterium]|nr:hypothetical protein [Acetobacteraceae bacterium]
MYGQPMLRIIIALLLLVTPGAGLPAWARTVLAATPISRMDLPWWRTRFRSKQTELRQKHPALIFLGDSITQNWERHGPPPWMDFAPEWTRFYGDRNAVNLGYLGDTTANLLWRVENGETTGIAPKLAVVLIGANNLGRLHWSAEDTIAGIEAIITALRRHLPSTRILLLGILPSDRSAWATEATNEVNQILATRYPRVGEVTFLGVGHVFMKDGKLNRELFYDSRQSPPAPPLHPTAEGQALMAEAIEPTLAALLGDKSHR